MSITLETTNKIKDIVKNLEWKSLSEIAKDNNIQVFTLDLNDVSWDNVSWAIFKSEDNQYKIYINSSDNGNRQRFTFAHELGHFFLHKDIIDELKGMIDKQSPYLFRTPGDVYNELPDDKKLLEEQANAFAAELLMPEDKVKKLWESNDDVKQLADFFWVSLIAMSFRLENLHLN